MSTTVSGMLQDNISLQTTDITRSSSTHTNFIIASQVPGHESHWAHVGHNWMMPHISTPASPCHSATNMASTASTCYSSRRPKTLLTQCCAAFPHVAKDILLTQHIDVANKKHYQKLAFVSILSIVYIKFVIIPDRQHFNQHTFLYVSLKHCLSTLFKCCSFHLH